MQIITEYTIYFLRDNTASLAYGQQVLARNQNPDLNMPAYFSAEDEAVAWVEANEAAMARAGSFVILPVRNVRY